MRRLALQATLLFAALLYLGCRHGADRCAFRDFAAAPYDHIVENLGTLEVRQFSGVLVSRDVIGTLPDLGARFELHGPRGVTVTVPVGPAGRFDYDLPPGEYCFKLSAPGFRSGLGKVKIDPRVSASELSIRLIISE